MNHKLYFLFVIFWIILFAGCSDSNSSSKENAIEYKALIGYRTYIDRVEADGQRTIVIIVSKDATKEQVKDLADFFVREVKENKIWLEIWDDIETLQKGTAITDADKVAHYILYVVSYKATGKMEYYWERNYS